MFNYVDCIAICIILLTHHFTGLPYYAGVPGVPSAFPYGPTVFVPPASAKQPAMGLANPSNQYHQQHQPNYGQHAYSAGETGQKKKALWLMFLDDKQKHCFRSLDFCEDFVQKFEFSF